MEPGGDCGECFLRRPRTEDAIDLGPGLGQLYPVVTVSGQYGSRLVVPINTGARERAPGGSGARVKGDCAASGGLLAGERFRRAVPDAQELTSGNDVDHRVVNGRQPESVVHAIPPHARSTRNVRLQNPDAPGCSYRAGGRERRIPDATPDPPRPGRVAARAGFGAQWASNPGAHECYTPTHARFWWNGSTGGLRQVDGAGWPGIFRVRNRANGRTDDCDGHDHCGPPLSAPRCALSLSARSAH